MANAEDEQKSLRKAAHAFNKILNTGRANPSRSNEAIAEATKKLRRLILIEGIPHSIVSVLLKFN